jgi:hypothetical protein
VSNELLTSAKKSHPKPNFKHCPYRKCEPSQTRVPQSIKRQGNHQNGKRDKVVFHWETNILIASSNRPNASSFQASGRVFPLPRKNCQRVPRQSSDICLRLAPTLLKPCPYTQVRHSGMDCRNPRLHGCHHKGGLWTEVEQRRSSCRGYREVLSSPSMALDTRFPAGMTTFVYIGMCLTPLDIPIGHKEKQRKPFQNHSLYLTIKAQFILMRSSCIPAKTSL